MKITVEEIEKAMKLEPASRFVERRVVQNNKEGFFECAGLRQTGRTTRMLMRAIEACTDGKNVKIYTHYTHLQKHMLSKLETMLDSVNAGYKIKDGAVYIGKNEIVFEAKTGIVLFDDSINECW